MEYFPLVSSAIDHVHVLLNGGEFPEVSFDFASSQNLVQSYLCTPSFQTFAATLRF